MDKSAWQVASTPVPTPKPVGPDELIRKRLKFASDGLGVDLSKPLGDGEIKKVCEHLLLVQALETPRIAAKHAQELELSKKRT